MGAAQPRAALERRALLEHLRLRQQFSICHGVARRRVGHLARANERVEEIGPRLRHVDAKDRSPRVADENDLVLPQLLAQQVGELDAVLRHARDRDGLRRRLRVLSECSAGAALIPLDHREVLQPQPEPGITPRVGRVARSAVKKEQHRVVSVFSANRDPLLDAADLDVPRLVDAVCSGDGVIAHIPRAQGCPCRFELLAVGAGRRILPGGRDGDANKKQEWPQSDSCSSHDSPTHTRRDIMAAMRNEDQRAPCERNP